MLRVFDDTVVMSNVGVVLVLALCKDDVFWVGAELGCGSEQEKKKSTASGQHIKWDAPVRIKR